MGLNLMMFDAKLIRKSLQTREYYRFLTLYVATIGYTPSVAIIAQNIEYWWNYRLYFVILQYRFHCVIRA